MKTSQLIRTALAAVLVLGSLAAGAGSASAAQPIQWGQCAPDVLALIPVAERTKVTCAVHQVPLDHSRPRGETIGLALMRRPADDPSKKIGSLFINPGGPGGAGMTYSASGARFFSAEVRSRFDLIGFDPRGVSRSTPLRCYQTTEEQQEVASRRYGVPITKEQIRSTIKASRDYTGYCARNAGPLLRHMSTEDVARDLDLLRQGVGDKQLTYVGFSYGTLLGATYVNLFPNRSRAIVLDGNVDAALRTVNGSEYDRQRADGFEIALDAFLERCDAVGDKCAFSPGDPRAKFDELRKALRVKPIGTVTHQSLIQRVASNLYSPATFTTLATWLQSLHAALQPGATVQAIPDLPMLNNNGGLADYRPIPGEGPYLGHDSYYGVNCTDKPFLRTPHLFPHIANWWERESPTFGRSQAASDLLTCSTWPDWFPDRYAGPWHRQTPNPVVVVGNYYDPATQYKFSQRMAKQLGNARLISVDAFGHCILGNSAGADAAVTRYLVDLKAPVDGTVFHPNVQPF